ncbi:hypothetical protein CJ204_04790 [Corynebacterium xerosis]|uniref:Uncharacterized protein n=1 Tax=Corynebacterium xerosis TaxID=1725 RepID=A0A2N6SZX8_9CORY|nr:hypothetical protein [Corynebacterium xerosis]PMC62629.1 hypothetical protein CJ204_04790 [Corynebacterium xerosis]
MRARTAGLGIAAIMAAATAGCAGASAVDGPAAPPVAGEGQLPRVADDSGLGADAGGSPSATSAITDAPDRATTVVPSPPRSDRDVRAPRADDPYLPPRAVIPDATGTPTAPAPVDPPTSTPEPPTTAPEETTTPTLPNPQRPRPLLPPGGELPDQPQWELDAPSGGKDPDKGDSTTGTDATDDSNDSNDSAESGDSGDSGDSRDSDGRGTTPNAPATATGAPSDR